MKKNYYSLVTSGNIANINIYGDITSYEWCESDMSATKLSKQLDELVGVTEINVFINSYGGEVAEGLAIYNALKRHQAKIKTYCDGFACSIASVIFMAGEERIMNESSLLMIHNAWSFATGNAEELRKQADDLDKITQASVIAYKAHSTLTEDEIKELMDNETWILPEEALDYGFATSIVETEQANTSQNARMSLLDIIKQHREEVEDDEKDPEKTDDETVDDEPETSSDDETVDDENSETDDEENAEELTDENDEEVDDEEVDDEGEETEIATQKLCSFFNAIFK